MKNVLLAALCFGLTVFLNGCLAHLPDYLAPGFEVRVIKRARLGDGTPITAISVPADVQGHHLGDINFPRPTVGFTRSYASETNANGVYKVQNGRAPASWYALALCTRDSGASLKPYTYVDQRGYIEHECLRLFSAPTSASRFEISGSEPGTLTLSGEQLSPQNGMPVLRLYDQSGRFVNSTVSTSVASDGASATFSFPKSVSGASLPAGIYGMVILNWDTPSQTFCQAQYDEWGEYTGDYCWEVPGKLADAGDNFVAIGASSSLPNALFGVDVVPVDYQAYECFYDEYYGTNYCMNWSFSDRSPVVTLSGSGQVYYNGAYLAVGANPTAIKTYALVTESYTSGDGYTYYRSEDQTRPSRALVVNTGSNSVSVLDLVGWQVLASIPVGNRPSALQILPDETTAFVVNFESSSVVHPSKTGHLN